MRIASNVDWSAVPIELSADPIAVIAAGMSLRSSTLSTASLTSDFSCSTVSSSVWMESSIS